MRQALTVSDTELSEVNVGAASSLLYYPSTVPVPRNNCLRRAKQLSTPQTIWVVN
jgi:hypothetical protein